MDIRNYRPVPFGWSDWYGASYRNLDLHTRLWAHVIARHNDSAMVDSMAESAAILGMVA